LIVQVHRKLCRIPFVGRVCHGIRPRPDENRIGGGGSVMGGLRGIDPRPQRTTSRQ
jgi:hypothetical protein